MSSIEGINFDGVDSSGFPGLKCTPVIPLLPEQRRSTIEVVGRDGVYDFNVNSYAPRIITVSCKVLAADRDSLRSALNNIANWLTGGGYLILNYSPNVRFYAKAYPQIDINKYMNFGLFDVQFECNPPWAEDITASVGTVGTPQDYGSLLAFYPQITVNMTGAGTYVQASLSGGSYVRVNHALANTNAVVIDMNAYKATFNGVYVPVTIDSLFFSVPSGMQTITIASDGTFTASMSYRKRYPYA